MKEILERYSRHPLYRALQAAVVLVIAFFLGKSLYASWNEVRGAVAHTRFGFLLCSLLVQVVCGAMFAGAWNYIIRALGKRVSYLRMIRVFYLSEMGKYLPGKVWTPMGRILLAEREGVPAVMAIASMGVQMVVQIVTSMLVVLLTLPFWPLLREKLAGSLIYFFIVIPLGLAALHPRIFNPFLNWALRRLSKETMEARLRYLHILALVVYWCFMWTLKGVATYFILIAVHPLRLPPLALIGVIGASVFSWLAGVLVFVVPAGLGVTEGLLAAFFNLLFSVDVGVGVTIALFSRLLGILAEVIIIGIACGLGGRGRLTAAASPELKT